MFTKNEDTGFSRPSISPVLITPNHRILSAQLLYPYWANYNEKSAYVRNTQIHFFRTDSKAPWTVIALPENDRYSANAGADLPNNFEQRYFKFLSSGKREPFKEGNTPKESAEEAWIALGKCYPAENQNVLQDPLTEEELKSNFQKMFNDELQSPKVSQGKTWSETRAEKYISDNHLKTTDELKKPVTVQNKGANYTTVTFDNTTFHLHRVDDKVLVFANTAVFNSLDQGALVLDPNPEKWSNQIQNAWLKQQVNVFLGKKYNPATKNESPYNMQLSIPATLICNAAQNLVPYLAKNNLDNKASKKIQKTESAKKIFEKKEVPVSVTNAYKHKAFPGGLGRNHFFKAAIDPARIQGEFKERYKDLVGDHLKTAMLQHIAARLNDTKSQDKIDSQAKLDLFKKEVEGSAEYRTLAQAQRLTSRILGLKTSSLEALESMYQQKELLLNEKENDPKNNLG